MKKKIYRVEIILNYVNKNKKQLKYKTESLIMQEKLK